MIVKFYDVGRFFFTSLNKKRAQFLAFFYPRGIWSFLELPEIPLRFSWLEEMLVQITARDENMKFNENKLSRVDANLDADYD